MQEVTSESGIKASVSLWSPAPPLSLRLQYEKSLKMQKAWLSSHMAKIRSL